jgi:hypothetical protein
MHAERSATTRWLSLVQPRTDAVAKPTCPRVGIFETITEGRVRFAEQGSLHRAKGCANTSTSDLNFGPWVAPFTLRTSVRFYDS